MGDARVRQRLVVTVGTDHHPFDRLMGWVDELLRAGLVSPDEVTVQSGASRPPDGPNVRTFMARAELMALMGAADVIIGQAGPGTIMDARSVGRRPVVVPRLASLGEVLDDHQVTFARHLATTGAVALAEELPPLLSAVETALRDPHRMTLGDQERASSGAKFASQRIAEQAAELRVGAPLPLARRLPRLRRSQRV